MSKLRLKIRDQARFQKKYPLTRHLPKTRLISDQVFEMETHKVNIAGQEEVTLEWSAAFSETPNVVVTFIATDKTQGDVNVYLSSVSTTQITINLSATATGVMHVQATVLGS